MTDVKVLFLKVGQSPQRRSHGQHLWCYLKGHVIRNRHAKYESPTSHGVIVKSSLKVFFSKVGQRSK